MRTSCALCLIVVLHAGCSQQDAPAPSATGDTATVSLGSGSTPYRARTNDAMPGEQTSDFGRGILHLDAEADTASGIHEDTVIVRNAPTDAAAIVARWIHRHAPEGTWEYRLETNEQNLLRADIEWLYEENGLPVDTIGGDSSWARVVHAHDDGGDARLGWVRLGPQTRVEWWPDVLMQQHLFFRRPDSLTFHAAPDGEPVSIEIQTGDTSDGLDYTMKPLAVRNGWMRVEVTSPSDYCTDPNRPRRDTVWIRYLDARGRPQVWYYTRGC